MSSNSWPSGDQVTSLSSFKECFYWCFILQLFSRVLLIPSAERVLLCSELLIFSYFSKQRKLREVSTKFQLFQKPANFEQRMLDCKRVLDGVKAELHVLNVKDVDPDVIQTHLDKCMVRPLTGECVQWVFQQLTWLHLVFAYMVCSVIICLQCAKNRDQWWKTG